jgi:hypothetical protein
VVGGEHDQRVLVQSPFAQRVQQPPDVAVDVLDLGVVVRQQFAQGVAARDRVVLGVPQRLLQVRVPGVAVGVPPGVSSVAVSRPLSSRSAMRSGRSRRLRGSLT